MNKMDNLIIENHKKWELIERSMEDDRLNITDKNVLFCYISRGRMSANVMTYVLNKSISKQCNIVTIEDVDISILKLKRLGYIL